MNAISRKQKVPIHFAQTAGQSRIVRGPIRNLDRSLGQRIFDRTSHGRVNHRLPRRGEIRINHVKETQIRVAIGNKVQTLTLGVINPAVTGYIGAVADEVGIVDVQ